MWKQQKYRDGQALVRAFISVSLFTCLMLAGLAACGSDATTSAGGGVSPWGLPFQTNTRIKIGGGDGCTSGGLHDDNFRSVPGYTLNGAGCNTSGGVKNASLDLITEQGSGVSVIPVAAGRVLKAWSDCRMVLVDHGGGIWVAYLHLQVMVSDNQPVNRDTVLGRTLPSYDARGTNCGDWSTAPHLHFAFLRGSGNTGQYLPMEGTTLCGHTVAANGAISGLGSPNGPYFSVPNCDSGSPPESPHDGEEFVGQSANPTVVPLGQPVHIYFIERNTGNRNWSDGDGYRLVCSNNCFGVSRVGFGGQAVSPGSTFQFNIDFPTSISPGTYRTVWAMDHNGNHFGHDLWIDIKVQQGAPPQSCSPPSLQGPGNGGNYSLNTGISLSWSADCPQAYTELWGGPYGTLNFGGWSSRTHVDIGTMYAGTYSWHVKARDASGNESGWSSTWSFTIAADPAPNPTATPTSPPGPTPAPISTPLPVPTPTPTQCPYRDGGSGVTFYSGANYSGQSWTWYVPAGNTDSYANLPSGIAGNLGSFYDSNNAWHVVLYQSQNGTGNLGHYDASWPNVDSYWRNTQSVKIYINRTC